MRSTAHQKKLTNNSFFIFYFRIIFIFADQFLKSGTLMFPGKNGEGDDFVATDIPTDKHRQGSGIFH
jgi:hypothetical protein